MEDSTPSVPHHLLCWVGNSVQAGSGATRCPCYIRQAGGKIMSCQVVEVLHVARHVCRKERGREAHAHQQNRPTPDLCPASWKVPCRCVCVRWYAGSGKSLKKGNNTVHRPE